MYETTFGPLCKSIGRTLGLTDVRYFSEELVKPFNYKYSLLPQFFTHFFAPKLLVDCFVSILCVSVLSEEELLKFHFNEVMFSYLAF